MHKEAQATRASRLKSAAIKAFIFLVAAFLLFIFAAARYTSASLNVLGFGTNQFGPFLMLQFSNSGPATISYRAYDTNRPFYNFQIQTSVGHTNYYKPFDAVLREFELNPHQTMNFNVLTANRGEVFRVTLDYHVPQALDWFRDHAPRRIAGWIPRPSRPTALSPLIRSNSLVTEPN